MKKILPWRYFFFSDLCFLIFTQSRATEYLSVGEDIAGASDRCMNDRFIMDVLEPVKKILDKIEEVRVW